MTSEVYEFKELIKSLEKVSNSNELSQIHKKTLDLIYRLKYEEMPNVSIYAISNYVVFVKNHEIIGSVTTKQDFMYSKKVYHFLSFFEEIAKNMELLSTYHSIKYYVFDLVLILEKLKFTLQFIDDKKAV